MNKIVERIAKERIVESIIGNVVRDKNDDDYKDLINDIYLELLEKSQDNLESIYNRGQINYFITRIVLNNINSVTSRYYYKYGKWKKNKTAIDETTDKGEEPDYN